MLNKTYKMAIEPNPIYLCFLLKDDSFEIPKYKPTTITTARIFIR
jgi:hypothetical protein